MTKGHAGANAFLGKFIRAASFLVLPFIIFPFLAGLGVPTFLWLAGLGIWTLFLFIYVSRKLEQSAAAYTRWLEARLQKRRE
jgi:hypothetical protein